jgi:hypothetical protein
MMQMKVARRNSIASNVLNENPGGFNQKGSVVPTMAGRRDAVQYLYPAD